MTRPDSPTDPEIRSVQRLVRVLLVFSFVVLLLRVQALHGLGLADDEALFASYSLHPQPAYLYHPGLIAVVMRWAGGGELPGPNQVHLFAAALAALVPWVALLSARALGAGWRGALVASVAFATLPAFVVEHSTLTPDLLLALTWPGAIGCVAFGIRAKVGSWAALLGWLAAGVLIGVGIMSHALGGALAIALFAAAAATLPREQWRSVPPWAALIVTSILAFPVVAWQLGGGLSMIHANLMGPGAGPSLARTTWVLLGQLVVLTPFPLLAIAIIWHDLARQRQTDPIGRLLWLTMLASFALVLPLALWSPQGGPIWLVPCVVPLALHLARRPDVVSRWLGSACVASAALVAGLAWVWVKTDVPVVALGAHYPNRSDIVNDLRAWGPGRQLLVESIEVAIAQRHVLPVVVGTSSGTCAQAEATVGNQLRVGCMYPSENDFERWVPTRDWVDAPSVLVVYDDRVTGNPAASLPHHKLVSMSKVDVRRGGRVVRTLRIAALVKARSVGLAAP